MEKFRKIDHYQLLQILGKGANGLVYKGLNTLNGSLVAIKQMIIGKSEIKAIKTQLNILKQLDHPCIVKYIDAIQKQNKIYLILEYMEGGSLGTLVRKSPVEQEVAKIFIKQVLIGLVFLHKAQVIHRDIKGANLLLTKNGQVKLADFGVAVKLEDGQKTISAAGSPYWMAPQIISSDAQPSTKCDIWSLGCTVVQLLTGNPPYFDLMQFPALFRIVQDKHPPIPECSAECKQFLLQCFIKIPKDRPTANELLNSAWLRSVSETQINSLKQQNQRVQKQIKLALHPIINYQQLQKILKQTKNSMAICKHKYFQAIIYDNRQNNPNAFRIQLMINLIRNDKNSFQCLYKTGIFGQQFQKLKQKYQPNQQFTILFYQLITILVQLYGIFVKQAQTCAKLGQHAPGSNIEQIETIILHKCMPSLVKLLSIFRKDKRFDYKYDLLVSLHQFMVSAINHNGQQDSQQMIGSMTKTLQQSGELKQILGLDLNAKNQKQYKLSIIKLQIIGKLLPSLLFLHELKPAMYKKHISYLIVQMIGNGLKTQNQSILISKLMCLNILTANDQIKASLQKNGIIYYLSHYYQQVKSNLSNLNVAALLESVTMLAKLLENNNHGIDKNRVVQFIRHRGAQSLEIISQSLQSQTKSRKKQSNTLIDKLAMVIAILQNYRT